jgi:hypothetical protein
VCEKDQHVTPLKPAEREYPTSKALESILPAIMVRAIAKPI